MFSLIFTWTNSWANHRDAGDLRSHRAHYDVTVMLNLRVRIITVRAHTIHGYACATMVFAELMQLDGCLNFKSRSAVERIYNRWHVVPGDRPVKLVCPFRWLTQSPPTSVITAYDWTWSMVRWKLWLEFHVLVKYVRINVHDITLNWWVSARKT